MAAQTSALPTAAQQAPPNFYETAAKMQGGQAGQAGAGGQGQAGAGAGTGAGAAGSEAKDPDREFLETVPKLLRIFEKLEALKPNGQDISKYMQSMAQTLKDCTKNVYKGEGGEQEGKSKGAPSDSTGDGGDTAGAAGSAGGGGQAGAGAGAGAAGAMGATG